MSLKSDFPDGVSNVQPVDNEGATENPAAPRVFCSKQEFAVAGAVFEMSASSSLSLTACVLLTFGFLFVIVGFATPWWVSYEHGTESKPGYYQSYYGLWTVSTYTGGER